MTLWKRQPERWRCYRDWPLRPSSRHLVLGQLADSRHREHLYESSKQAAVIPRNLRYPPVKLSLVSRTTYSVASLRRLRRHTHGPRVAVPQL